MAAAPRATGLHSQGYLRGLAQEGREHAQHDRRRGPYRPRLQGKNRNLPEPRAKFGEFAGAVAGEPPENQQPRVEEHKSRRYEAPVLQEISEQASDEENED